MQIPSVRLCPQLCLTLPSRHATLSITALRILPSHHFHPEHLQSASSPTDLCFTPRPSSRTNFPEISPAHSQPHFTVPFSAILALSRALNWAPSPPESSTAAGHIAASGSSIHSLSLSCQPPAPLPVYFSFFSFSLSLSQACRANERSQVSLFGDFQA